MRFSNVLPSEKIVDAIIQVHDLESINEEFFKLNKQITHLELNFSELITDMSCILKYLVNVTDLSIEGFSPSYTVAVDFTSASSAIKNLTLINCVINGHSLSNLQLDRLSICNCNVSAAEKYNLDDFVSKLNLIELHDLSDDANTLRNIHHVTHTDDIGYLSFVKSNRLKKLTIQFANHSHKFMYPGMLELITITNTNNANVIIKCNVDTVVMLLT
jgi:hypothetical protein